jgi:hypothetical protein
VTSDGPMIGRLRVSTWVISERRDTVYNGSRRQSNPLDERTSITVPLATIDFRVTRRFGLQGATTVPLIARTGVVPRATGSASFRDEVRGLGDTVAGAWYRAGSPSRWSWTVNGGISIPTGATRKPRFREELEDGSLVPLSRLQRGSGTWDPIVGAAAEHPVAGGRWINSLSARIPVAANDDGLQTGASWEVASGWAHTVRTSRIMAYGRVDWLHRQQDAFNGVPVLVGGGNWLYVSPGAAVMIGKGINLQAEVKVPVYRRLANRQLDSRAVLQFGLSRAF